jgi:hypothetical protein
VSHQPFPNQRKGSFLDCILVGSELIYFYMATLVGKSMIAKESMVYGKRIGMGRVP